MAKVALYSEQPVLSKGFAAVLSQVPELDLVCICTSSSRLSGTVTLTEPEVLVVDWNSEISLSDLVRIRSEAPSCRIVLWVHSISTELAGQTMRLGVHGILRKTCTAEVTITCLRKVAAAEYWFEEALTESVREATQVSLTPRETELVGLLAQGLKNKEIATALSISEGSIKVYLSKLFRKVGVKDRYELALHGLRNLVDPHAGNGSPTAARLAQSREVSSVMVKASLQPRPQRTTAASPGRRTTISAITRSAS